ncbi:Precursor of CEP3, partial [Cucurbita argyrosperma subsp. argyrosperma]
MLPTNLSLAFLFIALLIFSHFIDSASSRPLKTHTNHQLSARSAKEAHFQFHGQSVAEGKGTDGAVSTPSPPTTAAGSSPGRKMDDFRPTTPGHSPGVGHSIQN